MPCKAWGFTTRLITSRGPPCRWYVFNDPFLCESFSLSLRLWRPWNLEIMWSMVLFPASAAEVGKTSKNWSNLAIHVFQNCQDNLNEEPPLLIEANNINIHLLDINMHVRPILKSRNIERNYTMNHVTRHPYSIQTVKPAFPRQIPWLSWPIGGGFKYWSFLPRSTGEMLQFGGSTTTYKAGPYRL